MELQAEVPFFSVGWGLSGGGGGGETEVDLISYLYTCSRLFMTG